MTHPVSLQLTIHADSDADLDELLKLSLHNLAKLRSDTWHIAVGAVVTGETQGTLGSYQVAFSNGSPALVALHQELLAGGYQHDTFLSCESYGVYSADGRPDKKLVYNPPSIEDHDRNLL